MADYVLISGICQWQNGIQISVRHLDEISGVAEDDAMEVFENDYYWFYPDRCRSDRKKRL